MEKIKFVAENDEAVEFFVLDQTRINGKNYLLVADSEEDNATAYILKDQSLDSEQESIYEIVEDEDELDAVSGVFETLIEDIDIER